MLEDLAPVLRFASGEGVGKEEDGKGREERRLAWVGGCLSMCSGEVPLST